MSIVGALIVAISAVFSDNPEPLLKTSDNTILSLPPSSLVFQTSDERTPLLHSQSYEDSNDVHSQFCGLVGVPPSKLPPGSKWSPRPTTLYKRATRELHSQNITYTVTTCLSNTLLLAQVVLGATLTALGTSESSHVFITIFGVMNTVIAGLVAYLKSRRQPMRARMFRDDMERVVDEIENSGVMWLDISKDALSYDEINTDSEVTVRSEVSRLTRLYDRAVKTNAMNNPDIYMAGGGFDGAQAGLKARSLPSQPTILPLPAPAVPVPDTPVAVAAPVAPAAPVPDPDESPAIRAKPSPPPKENSVEVAKEGKKVTSREASPSSDTTVDHA
jgi:hypothetical protein